MALRGVSVRMTSFLAGFALGAAIVGASWIGNRVGYHQARADVAEAARLAARLRAGDDPRPEPDRRHDEIWARSSDRSFRRRDDDGPWVKLPPADISNVDRKKLVKKLEARDGELGASW